MHVDEITTAHIMDVLSPILTERHETASRVRQRMEAVFDWVVNKGYRSDNPAERRVLKSLPRLRDTKGRHRALPYAEVPAALEKVRRFTADPGTRLAFEFLVLTASRSGEVRKANWVEVLWDQRTWEIPVIKMKARRPHRVPLSERAMEILHEAWWITGPDGLIFPSKSGGSMASDMTYNMMLKRLGIPADPHGFRSSFTDWAEEEVSDSSGPADAALAHQEKNKTRRAYKRTDFFEQRIGLMQTWADYVKGGRAVSEDPPGIGVSLRDQEI